MIHEYLSLIICIVGGLLFIVCSSLGKFGEIAELGKLAFAVGLLAYLFGK